MNSEIAWNMLEAYVSYAKLERGSEEASNYARNHLQGEWQHDDHLRELNQKIQGFRKVTGFQPEYHVFTVRSVSEGMYDLYCLGMDSIHIEAICGISEGALLNSAIAMQKRHAWNN